MQQNAREEYTDEAFGRSEASKKRPKETEKKSHSSLCCRHTIIQADQTAGIIRWQSGLRKIFIIIFADNEQEGNLAFREREGYVHDWIAANEYTYNGLRFFWNYEMSE